MSSFDHALAYTKRWEGGFVDDPDDPGGATNYGVSLRAIRELGEIDLFDYDGSGDVSAAEIKAMRPQDADAFYREHFWTPWLDFVPWVPLATKLFDFGVNMGPAQRNRLLQRALNEQLPGELVVDGVAGEKTLRALEYTKPLYLLGDLEDHAARFYFAIADKRQASRKYLFGWLRRCFARPEIPSGSLLRDHELTGATSTKGQ